MSEVREQKFEYKRVEISGENGEQERAYKYLDKHYPSAKYIVSSDDNSFHIVLKTDERRISSETIVI